VVDRGAVEPMNLESQQIRLGSDILIAALECISHAVVITDREGNIRWVNHTFTAMTGYTSQEAVGRNARLLRSGRQDPAFYQDLWQTILSGRRWHGELVNRRKDGSLYLEEQTIAPLKGAGGEITHFVAVKQDITPRKNAGYRASLLVYALESAGECVVITDAWNHILYVNRAFQETYGYAEQELLGQHISMVRAPGSPRPPVEEVLSGTLKGGWRGEVTNRRKDGSEFPIHLSTSVVGDHRGAAVCPGRGGEKLVAGAPR